MSFQIAIPQSRRAAARFVGKVRRTIVEALADSSDIKRTDIADAIGVHRSVITRQLNGRKDISLSRVAELAWAMGLEPVLVLKPLQGKPGSNGKIAPPPASRFNVQTTTTTSAIARSVQGKQVEVA